MPSTQLWKPLTIRFPAPSHYRLVITTTQEKSLKIQTLRAWRWQQVVDPVVFEGKLKLTSL